MRCWPTWLRHSLVNYAGSFCPVARFTVATGWFMRMDPVSITRETAEEAARAIGGPYAEHVVAQCLEACARLNFGAVYAPRFGRVFFGPGSAMNGGPVSFLVCCAGVHRDIADHEVDELVACANTSKLSADVKMAHDEAVKRSRDDSARTALLDDLDRESGTIEKELDIRVRIAKGLTRSCVSI